MNTTCRTLWISDVHLGIRAAQAKPLLDFLEKHTPETLYLVGDIFDGWRLRKNGYWDKAHSDVVAKILSMSHAGVKVVYIPGNHDEMLRDYLDIDIAGVSLKENTIHTLKDGRTLLIMHGDEFDGVTKHFKILAYLGTWAYNIFLAMNLPINWWRRRLGLTYWSLAGYLKNKVKGAVEMASHFEQAVVREAKERNVNGIVCGHTHRAHMRHMGDVLYINTGDWVESCTALIEYHDGRLEILHEKPASLGGKA